MARLLMIPSGQLVFLPLSFSNHQLYHLGIYLGSCICPKWKIYVAAQRRPTYVRLLSLLRD